MEVWWTVSTIVHTEMTEMRASTATRGRRSITVPAAPFRRFDEAAPVDPPMLTMELRQLEAFMVVADELHFGRAAERLYVSPATLSELIRRLERAFATRLFTRTTRQVRLTAAGEELMLRTEPILADLHATRTAVRRVAHGEIGTVRLGCTPPVAPVLAPYLVQRFGAEVPDVTVEVHRMWLPNLVDALVRGELDVAITCGELSGSPGIAAQTFCAETLLVGLRANHPLATQDVVALAELENEVLGVTSASLFPAWTVCQRQALATAQVSPHTVELEDTDLSSRHWVDQNRVDWILLISSLAGSQKETAIRPVAPRQLVPFTLQWRSDGATTPAIDRFVNTALTVDPPPGWHTQPGHFAHRE